MSSLENRAMVPIFGTDPVELGLANQKEIALSRIRSSPTYQRLFEASFPGEPVSIAGITRALAAFQRSIVSFRSPYDRYRYLREEDTLIESAKRGMVVFFSGSKGGCFQCHGGLTLSGPARTANENQSEVEFHNTGLYSLGSPPGSYPAPNTGIHAHTGKPEDMGAFRAPTLRNIAVTAPYMHDGSVATLEEAIRHYEAGGRARNSLTSEILRPFLLRNQERIDLIAFLHSLTDEELLKDIRWANPWTNNGAGNSPEIP